MLIPKKGVRHFLVLVRLLNNDKIIENKDGPNTNVSRDSCSR